MYYCEESPDSEWNVAQATAIIVLEQNSTVTSDPKDLTITLKAKMVGAPVKLVMIAKSEEDRERWFGCLKVRGAEPCHSANVLIFSPLPLPRMVIPLCFH